ncbi:ABC transporter ATP-binding protein [Oceanobacillus sojae]|uniref:ABC transporter ATP-binding protein n=1 Tax=Oceanobacillus sojae TaxID=582851 RepID=A0A511ZJB8_9BACI|nr:oligopeptide/dipeptide ABC transporter ATP-binding protein [Oceanobacillus sojae]GEN87539.1 ABC transporter ATP-binding protein [Oceanobacillus sojae]
MNPPLLKIENLKKYFVIKNGNSFVAANNKKVVKAIDDVSLEIFQGETLGLVGESGCGKSTLGKNILRLQEPTEGQVFFKDKDILKYNNRELRRLRKEMQIIYQDPFGSLNPRFTIGEIIGEMYEIHKTDREIDKLSEIKKMLELVGLDSEKYNSYPHELSGGQRQRVGIARALALNPDFVVADEPVSALDVSVQSQIINLLMDLKKDLGLTMLFIAHGLNVVRHISDRVGVMYLGRIVEISETDNIFDTPAHPYTAALLSTVPDVDVSLRKERIVFKGEVPSPANPPSGCHFRTRCPLATEKCQLEVPKMQEVRNGHYVSCHFPLGADQLLKDVVSNL